jgi:hypothetical protein
VRELRADLQLAIDHDLVRGNPMTDLGQSIDDQLAGRIRGEGARVRDREDGDVDRDELALHPRSLLANHRTS